MFLTDTVLHTTYFFQQLYTLCFIFCLSHKPRKQHLKYLNATDIISTNTHFRVRNTYDEFQSSPNMTSQGQSHAFKTTYNVERRNSLHYIQLLPHKINEIRTSKLWLHKSKNFISVGDIFFTAHTTLIHCSCIIAQCHKTINKQSSTKSNMKYKFKKQNTCTQKSM